MKYWYIQYMKYWYIQYIKYWYIQYLPYTYMYMGIFVSTVCTVHMHIPVIK